MGLPPHGFGGTLCSMGAPLAYFLTWTCYGTWLHGDDRGAVDDEHNAFGDLFLPANPRRLAAQRCKLAHPPVTLNTNCRRIVRRAIEDHCRHRGWELLAVNVRTNHVHVVISFPHESPERVLGQLKAWATRRLREAGCVAADQRVWTHHGSTR